MWLRELEDCVLFPAHARAFFEICARAESRVDVAADDQGTRWPRAPFSGDRFYIPGKPVEEIAGDCVACLGPVQKQDANVPRPWGGNVLGLDDGIVAARAKSGDCDAVGKGGP